MKFGVKYDEMARRGDCLFQQTFLSFKVRLVLNNTAAAATCVTTFTPAIQTKVFRPKVAFLQDDLFPLVVRPEGDLRVIPWIAMSHLQTFHSASPVAFLPVQVSSVEIREHLQQMLRG